MAITLRASTTLAYGTRTNTTVARPTGTTTGDVIVVSLAVGGNGAPAPTAPAGWAPIASDVLYTDGGWNVHLSMWLKVYDGAASWTWTHSSSSTQAFVSAYSGVDNTTPIDVAATTAFSNTLAGPASATAASLTTVTAGALGIIARGSWDGAAITAPTGWTERSDTPVLWVADRTFTTAGATGSVSVPAGNTGGANYWGVIMGALRPAGVATPPGAGSASTSLSITAAASGRTAKSGSASTSLSVSGSASGRASHSGSASTSLAISGSATGYVKRSGTASGSLALTGSATGLAPSVNVRSGSASTTLRITGTASGSAVHSGVAEGTLSLSGAASGSHKASGSASTTLAMRALLRVPVFQTARNITVTASLVAPDHSAEISLLPKRASLSRRYAAAMTNSASIPRESVELVEIKVFVDDSIVTNFDISLARSGERPITWAAATVLDGAAGLLTGTLASGYYEVYVRIQDAPLAPVIHAGNLIIS